MKWLAKSVRVVLLCLLALGLTTNVWAANDAAGAGNTDKSSKVEAKPAGRDLVPPKDQAVQSAWDSLLQGHMQNLASIRVRAETLNAELPEIASKVSKQARGLREEFDKLYAVAQVSRNMPAELSVVTERMRRLEEKLDALTAPLNLSGDLSSRLEDLALLEGEASELSGAEVQAFRAELSSTRQLITQVDKRLERARAPAQKLKADLDAFQKRMAETMPSLWRDYYLSAPGKLYELASWSADLDRLHSFNEVLVLRMTTEIPQSLSDWFHVVLRGMTLFLPLVVLLFFSRRSLAVAAAAGGFAASLHAGWNRISRNSAMWLSLGLSLHYAAWANGNMYQIVASFATMSLCWGQMTLAWDLDSFDHPGESRLSPLWPMFIPLITGMVLLYFDPFPMFLSLAWLISLGLILWRALRRPREPQKLPRFLLCGFNCVVWASLLLTLFGFARLSILVCMAYTALAVCLQQGVSILHVGNLISEALPKAGGRGLAAGLIMALVMPAVLLVATLTPTLWILAYPGGAYLLEHMAGLGFNVGKVSFSAIQVLGIFIAFYLTRSLISVGITFMKSLRQQGVKLSPTLVGPFQTAYTYALWAFFGLYVLSSLGFSLTSLTVVAGGLSVGVGFGMQNIVQNFISGLMVIFGQIIREGDVVDVANITGTVRRVNIRSTLVETFDNATVFIPNSEFLSTSFTNWTHNGRMVRRDVSVGVAYGSDLALCMALLKQVAEEHPKVLSYPEPLVLFTDFASSSLNLVLRFWVADIDHGLTAMTEIRLRTNALFNEHNIEISFPQLDVHIKTDTDTAPVAPRP